MNVVLWVLQSVLAVAMLGAGAMKLTTPREALIEKGMAWAADFSSSTVRAIGVFEVLGAIGLVVPALVGVAPVLVPVAATGVALLMAGAVVVHVRRKEFTGAIPALALAVVAVALACSRFGGWAF